MNERRRELYRLLASEIARRRPLLIGEAPDPLDVRAALHSLRGSAAMAGEHDFALVLAQLGARVRAGDTAALGEILELLALTERRLMHGEPAFDSSWPEPPPGLAPSRIDEKLRREYLDAMRDRLQELDDVLSTSSQDEAIELVQRAYRSVHSMKGAAAAVGDDTTAWYCHGLEAALKGTPASLLAAQRVLSELARHRSLIGLLLEDQGRGLSLLADLTAPPSAGERRRGNLPSKPPSVRPPRSDGEEAQQEHLRVPAQTLDLLVEHLESFDALGEELRGAGEGARNVAGRLRELRASLLEALRLIGPPRPWGAPAAAIQRIDAAARVLGGAADNSEHGSAVLRRSAETLSSRARELRHEALALRRTPLRWLFERIERNVLRLAADSGREVRVVASGGELPVDRRVAERLLEPLQQLARNAIAHGIEPAGERRAAGKPEAGTIFLYGERVGDWLRVEISDDGRGADTARIHELALQSGLFSADKREVNEDDLLSLLFVPGLTTREGADLLAGRGLGLELAQEEVRRLGGAIRLGQRAGGGLRATLEVPSEQGVVDVVWLSALDQHYAIAVSFTGQVRHAAPSAHLVHLASCLGRAGGASAALSLELLIHGVQPISIGIDGLGEVEQVSVRPLPRLLAAKGPFSGAILRGDGSLRLALDPALLAARAWGEYEVLERER